jgi:uncharacterized membrane protein
MKQLLQTGRIVFAIGIAALGILCFILKDFIVGRAPNWPAGISINPALGFISGAILITASAAILLNKKGTPAVVTIAVLILILSLSRHLPNFMNDWANAYKTIALVGGSLIIAASFLKQQDAAANKKWINFFTIAGAFSFAAFFVAGGYAHFKYAAFVDSLIPRYIPVHRFWTYFCGIALFAAAAGLVITPLRKWAALASGIMIAGWFLLLHIPRFIANMSDRSDRLGLCESFTFAGILFVLAAISSTNNSSKP